MILIEIDETLKTLFGCLTVWTMGVGTLAVRYQLPNSSYEIALRVIIILLI